MSKLLFGIGGIERSGTTLLVAMLSGHPELAVVDDDEVFLKYDCYMRIDNQDMLNDFLSKLIDYHKKTEERGEDFFYNYHGLLKEYQQELLTKISFPVLLIDLYPVLLNILARKEKQSPGYIGFKTANMLCNPYNYFALQNSYPELKFMFIVRDPVIHTAAIMHYRKISAPEALQVLHDFYSEEYLSILLNNPFPVIKYEDLVENPERYYKIIQEYLEVKVLPYSGTISYSGRESYLGNTISTSKNKERLNLLSEKDRRYIEENTINLSIIMGYKTPIDANYDLTASLRRLKILFSKLKAYGLITDFIKRKPLIYSMVRKVKQVMFSRLNVWKLKRTTV